MQFAGDGGQKARGGLDHLPSNTAFYRLREPPGVKMMLAHPRSFARSIRVDQPGTDTLPVEKPSTPEKRLDSWKEIAAWINRDVTTAQRWEKRENMPVHRHAHEKRGSVYALTSELDNWLTSRKLPTEEAAEEATVDTSPAPVRTEPAGNS